MSDVEGQTEEASVTVTQGRPFIMSFRHHVRDYFLGDDPTFGQTSLPMCFLSMLLFTRHPLKTNFIFDEQEALLANPYVRSVTDPASKLHWMDAFHRDFWGLLPDRSIGSYRPIPDIVWRALWAIGARDQTPFLHHWVNVVLHGVNASIIILIVHKLARDRALSWLAGVLFVTTAVLTEAVSGVVGIADVLGALGALLALASLNLSAWKMPFAVFAATLFGLFSKESALCVVPLVPFAAVMTSQLTHPDRPRRWGRALLAAVATVGAFVLYVESRRRMFPTVTPAELTVAANADKSPLARTFAGLLRWYAQPALPRDPLNNPLVEATPPFRVAGALRVYARGLSQILFPWHLSGDYSAPQEPIPDRLIFPESVIGAIGIVIPVVLAPVLGIAAWWRRRRDQDSVDLRPLAGLAMVWIVVSYFPVSNVPVLLPTVRAERFWYFPAIGTCILLAMAFAWIFRKLRDRDDLLVAAYVAFSAFIAMQAVASRAHANDYKDDLTFWDATRHAVPRSAKAHLNYSVMQGARNNLQERLVANQTALDLAPKWPMATVYLGDTLCRMHRPAEAWTYYARGFALTPNDQNLIALGVQCLWDEHALTAGSENRANLEAIGERYPGTWLAFLARDITDNGEAHNGVDPKYRPRGYNEGPKSE